MSDESKEPAPKMRIVRARPVVRSVAPPAPVEMAAPAEPAPEAAAAAPMAISAPEPKSVSAPAVPAAQAEASLPEPKAAKEPGSDAALVQAVAGARRDSPRPAAAETPRRIPFRQRLRAVAGHPATLAAAAALALGGGFLGAQTFLTSGPAAKPPNVQMAEAAQSLVRSQQDVLRLAGDLKALKIAVDSLKEGVDRAKADFAGKQGQVLERFDRSERSRGETTARLAKLGEQLDRVEAAAKEPSPRLATLGDRLERIERQIAGLQIAAAKPAPPAPEPVQTGTVEPKPIREVARETAREPVKEPAREPAKESGRDAPIEGWTLHEVYDGVALIEGRNRRLYEVSVGGTLPGIGPVEAIERRNKRWVVVTPKGFIGG